MEGDVIVPIVGKRDSSFYVQFNDEQGEKYFISEFSE